LVWSSFLEAHCKMANIFVPDALTKNPVQESVRERRNGVQDDGGLNEDMEFLKHCASQSTLENRAPVVIISCGSFCPPHLGHLKMLHAAEKALPDTVQVTGFIMIPSPEEYIVRKFEQGRLKGSAASIASFESRKQLLLTMAADLKDLNLTKRIHVSASEQLRANWYMGNFIALDAAKGGFSIPPLIFATGPDRKGPMKTMVPGCDGVVVLPRADESVLEKSEWHPQHRENPMFVIASTDEDVFDASSTKVRLACLHMLGLDEKANMQDVHVAFSANPDAPSNLAKEMASYMTPNSARLYVFFVSACSGL